MATVFYLNIDTGPSAVKIRATQLHTEFHHDGPATLKRERFGELYREIASVPGEEPADVLAEYTADTRGEQVDADERGIEVGDIVRIADETFVYVPEGWQEIEIRD